MKGQGGDAARAVPARARWNGLRPELWISGACVIEVTPPITFNHAEIDIYDDHRIAMCFSLVALSHTAVTINDPKCTSKTFPDYFEKLASVSC